MESAKAKRAKSCWLRHLVLIEIILKLKNPTHCSNQENGLLIGMLK